MGGKDAIVVDGDADVDKAVDGVLASAFGYQGQKCSACSRAIVHTSIYEQFLEKLVAKTQNIKMGRSDDPATIWAGDQRHCPQDHPAVHRDR